LPTVKKSSILYTVHEILESLVTVVICNCKSTGTDYAIMNAIVSTVTHA